MTVPGSTAATTKFCGARIEFNGRYLNIDGNQKITAGNGSYDDPKPNAFSLPAAAVSDPATDGTSHCPYSTRTCRAACYVENLAKAVPDTYALYEHNAVAIREILVGPDNHDWAVVMGLWIRENCPGGFRWHVSGDLFSVDYADFIGNVVDMSDDVMHWIYTRSFEYLPPLLDAPYLSNLSINLSADRDNIDAAVATRDYWLKRRGVELRICYMAVAGPGCDDTPIVVPDGLPRDSVIFPDYALRYSTARGYNWFEDLPASYKRMVCPADRLGKSPKIRCGPCARCLIPNAGDARSAR